MCTAEIAVHTALGNIPAGYSIAEIEIPDVPILKLDPSRLPTGWKSFPYPDFTQKTGDKFISGRKFLVMKVPSAVVQGDHNFLINPVHEDFRNVRILGMEPFCFDERLFLK